MSSIELSDDDRKVVSELVGLSDTAVHSDMPHRVEYMNMAGAKERWAEICRKAINASTNQTLNLWFMLEGLVNVLRRRAGRWDTQEVFTILEDVGVSIVDLDTSNQVMNRLNSLHAYHGGQVMHLLGRHSEAAEYNKASAELEERNKDWKKYRLMLHHEALEYLCAVIVSSQGGMLGTEMTAQHDRYETFFRASSGALKRWGDKEGQRDQRANIYWHRGLIRFISERRRKPEKKEADFVVRLVQTQPEGFQYAAWLLQAMRQERDVTEPGFLEHFSNAPLFDKVLAHLMAAPFVDHLEESKRLYRQAKSLLDTGYGGELAFVLAKEAGLYEGTW